MNIWRKRKWLTHGIDPPCIVVPVAMHILQKVSPGQVVLALVSESNLNLKSFDEVTGFVLCVVREDTQTKKLFNSGIARKGGGLPLPEFFGHLFLTN